MIEKDIEIEKLDTIFKCYKNNYSPIINEFTHNIVFIVDNKVVSFVIYNIIYENVEIIDVFTDNTYRKKGYSFRLLNEIIKDNNDKNITLEVNKNNKIAIRLYEKLGFKEVAVRKGYYNGIDALLMLKK